MKRTTMVRGEACFAMRGTFWVLLLVMLTWVAEASAGGLAVTTFGARRTGMLANMAAPDNATALFHNPAGLADQAGTRLHLSGSLPMPQTEFRIQQLDENRFPTLRCDDNTQPCRWPVDDEGYYDKPIRPRVTAGSLPYVGISQDLGVVGETWDDFVLSAAITVPNFFAGNLPDDGPTSYFGVEGYFLAVSSILGIGWRINDKLAVGGNVMYNHMRINLSRRISLSDTLRGRNPTEESKRIADIAQLFIGDVMLDYLGVDHGLGWTLSALYEPTDWVSFGVTYSDATDPRFTGDVRLAPIGEDKTDTGFQKAVRDFGYRLPDGLRVEMPIPPSLSAGTNIHVSSRFEIGADCRLWFHNLYDQQVMEPIYESDFEGTPAMTREQLTQDEDFGVSYDISVGGLIRPVMDYPQFELLAGVGFDKSPVPEQSLTVYNPSMDNYRFAGGVRWNGQPGLRVSLTYVYFSYVGRDVTASRSSPPLNAQTTASTHAPRLEVEYAF